MRKILALCTEIIMAVAFGIWLGGITGLLLYASISLLIELISKISIPDYGIYVSIITMSVVWSAAFLWFFRKYLKDGGEEDNRTEKVPVSRLQSVLYWLTVAGAFFTAAMLPAYFLEWNDGAVYLLPAVFPAAIAAGVLKPFPYTKYGTLRGCGGVFCSFALLIMTITILAVVFPYSMDYYGNDINAVPHLSRTQKMKYFPAGATDLRVEGSSGCYEFSCKVSNADFEKYLALSTLKFVKNRTDYNDGLSYEELYGIPPGMPEDMNPDKPFYFYSARRRDGGGITLRYDIRQEQFRGWYSSH